jgi:NadR type nicotinamide-nucleotide adenylyltransferase
MEDIKKIVIIGPESTGKSTLTKQLAEHYNTSWCPEYARAYLNEHGTKYTYTDLLRIAEGQNICEETFALEAQNGLFFIDTNMYVMKVWCEYVFGNCHQYILDEINAREYDLYLLCNIDLPWADDPLREYPDEGPRKELYNIYKDILINQSVPWVEISGVEDQRLNAAIKAVKNLQREII